MRSFGDVHEAYWFLAEHPVRGHADTTFVDVLDVTVMKVDPGTRRVDDDAARNTAIEVWLESGPGMTEPSELAASVAWHDADLDVGAATFEAALIRLAEKVAAKYGDPREGQPAVLPSWRGSRMASGVVHPAGPTVGEREIRR